MGVFLSSARGVEMPKTEDVWTEQEMQDLRNTYDRLVWEDLENKFGRPKDAIRAKANRMGLTRGRVRSWSEEEDAQLTGEFLEISPREAERKYGRSWVAISQHARKIGLASRSEIWTEQEIEFLEKNYAAMGFDEV